MSQPVFDAEGNPRVTGCSRVVVCEVGGIGAAHAKNLGDVFRAVEWSVGIAVPTEAGPLAPESSYRRVGTIGDGLWVYELRSR